MFADTCYRLLLTALPADLRRDFGAAHGDGVVGRGPERDGVAAERELAARSARGIRDHEPVHHASQFTRFSTLTHRARRCAPMRAGAS